MAKAKKPTVSPPAPFEQNTDTTTEEEVIDTPDLQAFRAYSPDMSILNAATDAQFENARRNVTDSYGAYSGIPSQVVRNRLRDEALSDLEGKRSVALAEGSEKAQALKLAQLQALAELTRRTKTRQTGRNAGYNTSVISPQGSNVAGAAISGGASVASVALPAIIAA
jgi:hypothetical protein